MRTAVKVLGIVGGIFGFLSIPLRIMIAFFGTTSGMVSPAMAVLLAITFGTIAIIGGALADKNSHASWLLLLLSGAGGLLLVGFAWVVPGIMLLIGAALEFQAERRRELTV